MNERLKQIRKFYGLTQAEFGEKIGLKPTAIGLMETGNRTITERTLILLKEKYNVNPEWLKYGTGTMFIEINTFSLEEYAARKEMTEDELEIVKCYLELDPNIRHTLIEHFKTHLLQKNNISEIDKKTEAYRKELIDQLKGGTKSEILQITKDA